ncbi:MAG: aspartate-semialdehyde dehydrogenase [Acidobacteria bacterium]|nr:aspartate-semialdehyde dehydrogenase [Acidobacteriota bacterium]MBI3421464.1 aspartate-semialdehyde dehydrogenase [Acidobacteriota bacterium]
MKKLAKRRVGILGATGTVGQRVIHMLRNHPYFTVTALAASDRSEGKRFADVCKWKLPFEMPDAVKDIKVFGCKPPLDCDVIISSLPSDIAVEAESAFAAAGYPVISNSSSYRMPDDVPLVVPEINPDHLDIIPYQQKKRGYGKGYLVTNPNCTTIGLVMMLAPLHKAFGVEAVMMTSMQAISGAGYPGEPSMDIIDNVIPHIGGEEEKVEMEPQKILGKLTRTKIVSAPFLVSAQCNRVAVQDGHLESVRIKLKKKATVEQVIAALESFTGLPQELKLPTAPARPIIVRSEKDRPQPRLDRDAGNGMATVVGRISKDTIFDFKLTLISHNTVRGAAGAALLNAELLVAKGLL